MAYERHVETRGRRPNPTWYFVLGAMWTVLAVVMWASAESTAAAVAFVLLGIANLALGASLLRKQRAAQRARDDGGLSTANGSVTSSDDVTKR